MLAEQAMASGIGFLLDPPERMPPIARAARRAWKQRLTAGRYSEDVLSIMRNFRDRTVFA